MLEDCVSRRPQLECLYSKQLHMNIPSRIIVGMYDIFLKQWLKVFPRNQIMILRNEDYSKDIKSYMKRVYDFLQLRSLSDSELDNIQKMPRAFEKTDQARQAGPMMPETRLILDKFYSKYNKQLAETLGDPKYLWDSNN
ncbi:unnamed protein product [Candidula unifasciata]|uniref:Sulfotransferase domain-containing protein n=1 Tax=Candidula unifasciata TaxID=100452 RepID=A0A8S3ZSR2_9EUPU|nr:unnamed protein product [Candidula unifasciata]